MNEIKKKKRINRARLSETIFYTSIVAIPVALFILLQVIPGYFYIFIFAAQKYDVHTGEYFLTSDIFYNFRWFFQEFSETLGWSVAIKNSLILFAIGWAMMPLSLFVSFFISKKMPGSKVFKVILMMPGMLAGMIWVLLYKNFVERMVVDLFGLPYGPLSNIDQQFVTLLVYSIWLSAAGGMLLYTGVLSGVSPELIDAGRVDGLGLVGEFWHVSLPHLYPVWMVSAIGTIPGFFNATNGAFEFFGLHAHQNNYTIGYLMFCRVMGGGDQTGGYGFNAAGSIVFSLIAMPLTMIGKWALERYGPSEDSREPIRWFWQRRKEK